MNNELYDLTNPQKSILLTEEYYKGSNINNVKNAHLQNYHICLPPLEEQQRIVQKIEELFLSLDDIQTALEV